MICAPRLRIRRSLRSAGRAYYAALGRRIYSPLMNPPVRLLALFPLRKPFFFCDAAQRARSQNPRAADGPAYDEADESLLPTAVRRDAVPSGRGCLHDTLQDVPGRTSATLLMAKMPRDSRALEEAMEYAARTNSTALLIWQDGLIQAARYFGDTRAGTPLVSRSLAKPMAVIAVGRAIQEGHIASLDESAANYFHEWRDTPKAAIRVRHFLDMRSGLLRQAPGTGMRRSQPVYLHPATTKSSSTNTSCGEPAAATIRQRQFGAGGAPHQRPRRAVRGLGSPRKCSKPLARQGVRVDDREGGTRTQAWLDAAAETWPQAGTC